MAFAQGFRPVAHSTVIEGLERLVDQERATSNRALRSLFATLVRHKPVRVGGTTAAPTWTKPAYFTRGSPGDRATPTDSPRQRGYAFGVGYRVPPAPHLDGHRPSISARSSTRCAQSHARGFDFWAPPEWWTAQEHAAVSGSREAERVTRRYIRQALAERPIWFGDERPIDPFVFARLGPIRRLCLSCPRCIRSVQRAHQCRVARARCACTCVWATLTPPSNNSIR